MERMLGTTTIYNSSFQELSLGGGRCQSGVWAHRYFKIVFHLKKAFSSTLSHVHTLTHTPQYSHVHTFMSYLHMIVQCSHITHMFIYRCLSLS